MEYSAKPFEFLVHLYLAGMRSDNRRETWNSHARAKVSQLMYAKVGIKFNVSGLNGHNQAWKSPCEG